MRIKIVATNTMASPPQYIGKDAEISESLIADGCSILGSVENSVLSHGVHINENSTVRDSVIMPNVKIGKNVIRKLKKNADSLLTKL